MSRKREQSLQQQVERARDELFSHIHRCGVLQATAEHQVAWMADTTEYLGERYPELGAEELEELQQIGMRFCRPVIQSGDEAAAEHPQSDDEAAEDEAAAA